MLAPTTAKRVSLWDNGAVYTMSAEMGADKQSQVQPGSYNLTQNPERGRPEG